MNMAGMSMAKDLRDKGIAVGIVHPGDSRGSLPWGVVGPPTNPASSIPTGMVATDMTVRFGHDGCITTEESAKGILARADELSLANSGSFWHQNGQILPW